MTGFISHHSQSSENMLVTQMKKRSHGRLPFLHKEGDVGVPRGFNEPAELHVKTNTSPTHSTLNLRKTRSFWNSITGLAGW